MGQIRLPGARAAAFGAALVGATAGSSSAYAQGAPRAENGRAIEELVVTARKREETLQDIPVAGSAIGTDEILRQGGLTDNQQIASLLTGVSLDQDGNPEFFIRGAGVGRVPTTDSATTQMRNGAEIAGGFGGRAFADVDLFDVGQVEVYRGPQGALYGRNAVGGVLNIVSQTAKPEFEYSLLGEANTTADGYRLEGIVNVPLIPERLFLRVGLQYQDEKGLYYNEFLRERFQGDESFAGRIVLRSVLTENLEATLFLDHGRSETDQLSARDINYDLVNFTGSGVVDPSGAPVTGFRPLPLSGDSFRQAFDTRGRLEDVVSTANLNVSYDTAWGAIQSTTQYRSRQFESFTDVDRSYVGGPLYVAACGVTTQGRSFTSLKCEDFRPSDTKIFTQELRIVSPADRSFTWLAGVDLRKLKNSFDIVRTGRANAPNPFLVRNSRLLTEADNTQIGVFANASQTFFSNLTATVGLRYSREEKDFDSRRINLDAGRANTGQLVGPPQVGAATFKFLDPAASLSYNFGGGALVYASYARAHRAGGFNQDDPSFAGRGGFAFKPEVADSFEAGAKARFLDGALNASIAGFIVKYDNLLYNDIIQATDPLGQGSQIQFVENGGTATSKGVELDITARVREVPGIGGLATLRGGVAYTVGEFTESVAGRVVKGDKLALTPEWNINANMTYTRPLTDDLGLFLNTTYSYEEGGVDGVIAQIPRATFTRINAQVGLEGGPDDAAWRFVFFVNNLRDVQTDTRRDATGAPKSAPRTMGFRLSLRGY